MGALLNYCSSYYTLVKENFLEETCGNIPIAKSTKSSTISSQLLCYCTFKIQCGSLVCTMSIMYRPDKDKNLSLAHFSNFDYDNKACCVGLKE